MWRRRCNIAAHSRRRPDCPTNRYGIIGFFWKQERPERLESCVDAMNTQRPVCEKYCSMLDAVDFNKSCAGDVFAPSGKQIQYALCGNCGFCFAPEICGWPLEKFEQRIYNDKYILVDPDYVETRPKANAAALYSMFGNLDPGTRHLDYGGGNGTLVNLLREVELHLIRSFCAQGSGHQGSREIRPDHRI